MSLFRIAQTAAAVVVARRLARGRDRRPPLGPPTSPVTEPVSVVVPARDEADRIGPLLDALAADPAVAEVVVVDDRSSDATAEVARRGGARVVAGRELATGWVGKPWALEQGLAAARGEVVVCLDADVRPDAGLVAAVAAEVRPRRLVTGGGRFVCRGGAERALHAAFLQTVVHRMGAEDVEGYRPSPRRAIANGQCLAFRADDLRAAGGFALAAGAMTDDVALARALVARGWEIRFRDAHALMAVEMYEGLAATWEGWGRSLMGPDVNPPWVLAADLATLWLVQALPLVRLLARRASWLDRLLVAQRLALLVAAKDTYRPRGAAYWLSPLADVPALVRLTLSVLRPTRTWRGRDYAG